MSDAAAKAFELFQGDVGTDEGTGEWFEVTQEQINQFADVTHDHQFIHVDPERAKATPFGTTIAHGFLTLSMLTHLAAGASSAPPALESRSSLSIGAYAQSVMRAKTLLRPSSSNVMPSTPTVHRIPRAGIHSWLDTNW